MISYFDSSLLLSILFDEKRQSEAVSLWKTSTDKVSSILLRIETVVSLRRFYENNKHRLTPSPKLPRAGGTMCSPDASWLAVKTSELSAFLDEVTFLNIDKTIDATIYNTANLAKCRTLDAIHIATALDIRKSNNGNNINLYTFDTDMRTLAMEFGFILNRVEPLS
jgi:predicted nucleic acid-binding protein